MSRADEKIPAKITGARSKYNNCCCDMCHGLGYVVKIRYPRTLYYDGKKLEPRYNELWICDECRAKLIDALNV